jgi:hypothetical protein
MSRGAPPAYWMSARNLAVLWACWPRPDVTSGQLAERFGTTRNAIIAKATRLGIPCGRAPSAPGKPNGWRKPATPPPAIVARPVPPGARTLPPLPSETAARDFITSAE